ncbi:MAG TPA: hypothetical protein VIC34_13835 [Croceibacterium sp.]|jgi:hypothetical protein
MHIHLPKVPHSWREFLKEYAIIVLGVLTALALEQAVESLHDRRLAREAQEAIDQEMQADVDRTIYRVGQQACIDKRLDEIQALLADWHDDNAFPAGLRIGFPGDVGLVYERWQANLASGRFNEETPQEQSDQAGLYSLIKIIDSLQLREIDEWTQLRALEFGSRSLSMASKPMIANALAKARADARSFELLAGILVKSQAARRAKSGPRSPFVPAQPGTACEPMRNAGG